MWSFIIVKLENDLWKDPGSFSSVLIFLGQRPGFFSEYETKSKPFPSWMAVMQNADGLKKISSAQLDSKCLHEMTSYMVKQEN